MTDGHKLLHFSNEINKWLVSGIQAQLAETPALKDGIVALMSLRDGTSPAPALATFHRAIESLNAFLSSSAAFEEPVIIIHATLLMSQLSVSCHLALIPPLLRYE